MPVGRSSGHNSSGSKRKEDVSEKVREIKQRQQNWLVQRDLTKQKENVISKHKQSPPHLHKSTLSGSSSSKISATSSYQPTIPSSKPRSDQGKTKISETFNNWRKAKENNLSDEDHDTYSIRSGAESELERLVSPDLNISKEPVAEEEFGNLADKIANRVKENMGISESYISNDSEFHLMSMTDTLSQESASGPSRCKTFTQKASALNHFDTSAGLTSHNCSVCKILMFSPDHIPMMIIPCGHTLCKACSEEPTQCPECNCSIVSLTVNIMLQQVIQEYQSQSHRVPSSTIQKSSHRDGSGNKRISGTSSACRKGFDEDDRRQRITYQSQLLNLQTRQSVLSEEHSLLMEKLGKVTRQIQQTSSQTKSIVEQEHEIKKAIVELQERLSALETHRKQYEFQLTDLHDEKSETEGKITLLSGTLSSLSREVEKVKLLAEGEQNAN